MALDAKTERQFHRVLKEGDSRLLAQEAERLWRRVQRLLGLNLTPPEVDHKALELACFALQLPDRTGRCAGKLGQVNLRERTEQAAELLIGAIGDSVDEQVLDRTARLLRELAVRSTKMPEARLLADALNLEDFGVTGLMVQAMQLARQQASVAAVAEGFEKRQEYGYWEARLKDGFHFEPVRQMARARLENARQVARLLIAELMEDQAR